MLFRSLLNFLGSGLVVLGRFFGWLVPADQHIKNDLSDVDLEFKPVEQIRSLFCNFAFAGFAVLLGVLLLFLLLRVNSPVTFFEC